MITLKRPLAFLDIESTGCDPAVDRIVTLGIYKLAPEKDPVTALFKCNPMRLMADEVIQVHGITNEMVKGWKPFAYYAAEIVMLIRDSDIGGFNCTNFDIPLLWEEFHRSGIKWDLDGVHVLDAGNIFKKCEERTLSAAVQFYCGRPHEGAHGALEDAKATQEVLSAQLTRYPALSKMSVPEVAEFSKFDNRVDLAGKIVLNDQGVPVYNMRRVQGTPVVDDPGFASWMLDKDFTENTKMHLRRILGWEECR